ncbi:MAG: hypothetical protein PHQ18_01045 [Patescibacteria group bacterium]|nr:hypothetical protein [Patescibacteria group bacterium]
MKSEFSPLQYYKMSLKSEFEGERSLIFEKELKRYHNDNFG